MNWDRLAKGVLASSELFLRESGDPESAGRCITKGQGKKENLPQQRSFREALMQLDTLRGSLTGPESD
jgi:hypothetical protein